MDGNTKSESYNTYILKLSVNILLTSNIDMCLFHSQKVTTVDMIFLVDYIGF